MKRVSGLTQSAEILSRLFLLFLFFSGVSCTKIIPSVNDDEPHQYVLNCFLSPDDPTKILISRTTSILGKGNYSWDDEWDIKLYEDGDLLPFKPAFVDSSYQLYYSVLPGSHYRVEALNLEDDHLLIAEDVVPQKVELTELSNVYPLYTDRHETIFGQLTLRFHDDGEDVNFYEIVVGKHRAGKFNVIHTFKVNHPVITYDSEQDFYPLTLLFTNELFRGEELVMDIVVEGSGGAILLRKVSYNYFMYKKHLYAHLNNQNRDKDLSVITDPVMLYSNLENGLGIFAGFCQDLKWVDEY